MALAGSSRVLVNSLILFTIYYKSEILSTHLLDWKLNINTIVYV